MKCKEVQKFLVKSRESKSPRVEEHLTECLECRQWLFFQESLDSNLDFVVPLPNTLETKVRRHLEVQPARRALGLGNPIMKRIAISSTMLVTAGLGFAFLLPKTAQASNATETFNKMRSAISMAAYRGDLVLKVKALSENKFEVSGTLGGSPLPKDFPMKVTIKRNGDMLETNVDVDLHPKNYTKISYGKNEKTLVLVSKEEKGKTYEIQLDPKSYLPRLWVSYTKTSANWTMLVKNEYPALKSAKTPTSLVEGLTFRVRSRPGATAFVKLKGNKFGE